MALPSRVPPPPDRNERLREEQVEFESKRPGGLAIVGIIGQALDVKAFPAIWVPAQSPATATLVADHLANLLDVE